MEIGGGDGGSGGGVGGGSRDGGGLKAVGSGQRSLSFDAVVGRC